MTLLEAANLFFYKDGFLYRKSDGRHADKILRKSTYSVARVQAGPKKFISSRIIWVLFHGKEPLHEIDHIDGNSLNNLIANLRDVPHADNQSNMCRKKIKATKLPQGVNKGSGSCRFQARMMHRGKFISLGHHDTPELAHQAYLRGKKIYCKDKAPNSRMVAHALGQSATPG